MNPPYMCGDCLCRVCARNECGDNYAEGVDDDCLGCNGCSGTVDLLEDCPKEAFVPDEEIKAVSRMNETPIYRDPPTLRDYEDFQLGIAYTRGWNDAMNAIFPEEAEKRRNEEMKKNLRVVPKE